jgi:hypothetical protein
MGLLDFLRGKRDSRAEIADDRIWLTDAAKLNGIGNEMTSLAAADVSGILLAAHFPDVVERLSDFVAGENRPIPVACSLVRTLSLSAVSSWQLRESAVVGIIVAEHHPLSSHDAQVIRFAEQLPCRSRLVWHVSLEDPFLKIFVGEWATTTLRQLGMSESEAIEGRMVSRRIKAAQKSLEQRAFGEKDARSAAEWLEVNLYQ